MENTKVLTVAQAAQEISRSKNLIYRQARLGKIPGFIRIGDLWVISRCNWEKYLNGESQTVKVQ